MARKTTAASESQRGFNDVIGIGLMVLAVLLLVAVLSFDRHDLAAVTMPPNRPEHNWIGPLGARMAYWSFLLFGISGYMLPVLVAFVGFGCFFEALSYMKRRWPWGAILLVSLMGLLHLADLPHLKEGSSLFARARIAIGAPSLGGLVGQTL